MLINAPVLTGEGSPSLMGERPLSKGRKAPPHPDNILAFYD